MNEVANTVINNSPNKEAEKHRMLHVINKTSTGLINHEISTNWALQSDTVERNSLLHRDFLPRSPLSGWKDRLGIDCLKESICHRR